MRTASSWALFSGTPRVWMAGSLVIGTLSLISVPQGYPPQTEGPLLSPKYTLLSESPQDQKLLDSLCEALVPELHCLLEFLCPTRQTVSSTLNLL